jgi:hypothetical protein
MNDFFLNLGRRKLFTTEEKVLLNKRVPDLEAATSVSYAYAEQFSSIH